MLTSGIPVLLLEANGFVFSMYPELFVSMVIKGLRVSDPFALNAHILSTLDPDFDPRPSLAMALADHCDGSVEMSSCP